MEPPAREPLRTPRSLAAFVTPDVKKYLHDSKMLFVVSIAIGVGGINKRAPFIKCMPNDFNCIVFISKAIIPFEAHGAVSDSADGGTVTAEISMLFHFTSPFYLVPIHKSVKISFGTQ